jgi:flagellar protein FliO/FliZ
MSNATDSTGATTHSGTAAHVFAAPEAVSSDPVAGVAGIGQVTLALCIVLGAIFLCAWLARRMRSIGGGRPGAVSVIADVRLGPKERAVLLQVGATQVLVGVAPGQVNPLHVLSEPLAASAATPATLDGASFKSLLRRSLGK